MSALAALTCPSLEEIQASVRLSMNHVFNQEVEKVVSDVKDAILNDRPTVVWTSARFWEVNRVKLPASYVAELSVILRSKGYSVEHNSNQGSFERMTISGWKSL